ncbi:bud site selection protein 31 [Pancytospora philotis]|nr:bud site selection protein 31 [Pancytospora philotis]
MVRLAKSPPEEFSKVRDFLATIKQKMTRVEENARDGELKASVHEIYRLYRLRTWHLHQEYLGGNFSARLYRFLVGQKYIDTNLVRHWKKNGYENLCCLRCIQPRGGGEKVCLCRTPQKYRSTDDADLSCNCCGCNGCAGY